MAIMILIISQNSDLSTSNIIDWLPKSSWIRINEGDISNLTLSMTSEGKNSIIFNTSQGEIDLDTISNIWYRRGSLMYTVNKEILTFPSKITSHINYEWDTLRNYLNENLDKYPILGSLKIEDDLNKLSTAQLAASCGFRIPDSLITSQKSELIKFKEKHKRVITKGIQRNPSFTIDQKKEAISFNMFTTEIHNKDIQNADETFFPTLFQELCDKIYELRIFYLDGDVYPMAKFPNSHKTSIDIKNIAGGSAMRNVPYNLPESINEKLKLLMGKLGLNCASIDIIVDDKDIFTFLEINPMGQFDALSKYCNFNLDKKIANKLLMHYKKM